MTDWLMVIITTIYVVATIIICKSNYKSAKLSSESNEISLICKIVEIEQSRLTDIKNAIDNFVSSASFNHQIDGSEESFSRINAIKESYHLLQRCILVDNDVDRIEYKKMVSCAECFYVSSIELCEWLHAEYDGKEDKENVNKRLQRVVEIQSHFFESKEQYILSREQKITKVLVGQLPLSEAKRYIGVNNS